MELTNNELKKIVGGNITGTLLNSIIKGMTTIIDLGRSLGTAIRRIKSNSFCKV